MYTFQKQVKLYCLGMNTYIDRKAIEQKENMSIIQIKWKVVIRRFTREGLRPL